MSISRLILLEILHRKLSFILGLLAVTVAVGALVGQVVLLAQHDQRTEQLLQAKEAETKARMDKLQDEIRIITKNLGFNIRILPKELNLADLDARDFADKYMPEEYAQRLAQAKLVTINHLLPSLEQKVHWPELDKLIVLIGTRGEVPILAQAKKKPILEAVPPGKVVVGFQLRRLVSKQTGRDLKIGDPLPFKGKAYLVHQLHEARGDRDDNTLWINLKEAQELLDKRGLINGILALECNCSADRLGVIRDDIAKILPDTQVEEYQTKATARAEARTKVEAEGQAAVARERDNRQAMRQEKEALAAIVLPLVILGCCVWLGLTAWLNVLERETEIGLYRALGLRSSQLLTLFLSRAMLVGLIGAVLGAAAGVMSGWLFAEEASAWSASVSQPLLLVGVVVAAPLVSALACWIPSLLAVRRDPAVILQRE